MSAKLPRVNTLAPAGVWNLLHLCQLATWRRVGLKECVMSEGVGGRGHIYPVSLQGSVRLGPNRVLEAEKSQGKRKKGSKGPGATPHLHGLRLLMLTSFFSCDKLASLSPSQSPSRATSPRPVTPGPLKLLSWLFQKTQSDQTACTLNSLRSRFGVVNTGTQATC